MCDTCYEDNTNYCASCAAGYLDVGSVMPGMCLSVEEAHHPGCADSTTGPWMEEHNGNCVPECKPT